MGRGEEAAAAARHTGEVIAAEIRGFRRAIEALRDDQAFDAWCDAETGRPRRPEILHLTKPGRLVAADYLESLTKEGREGGS